MNERTILVLNLTVETKLLIFLLLLCLLTFGCQPSSDPDHASSTPPPALSEDELSALEAIGYVTWDENADTRLQGVVHHDEELSWPGYNLYTNEKTEVHLLDMKGERVHTWRLDPQLRHCEHAELLEGGDILVICVSQAIFRLDWNSNVVWSNQLTVHHDVAVLSNGTLLVPVEDRPREYANHLVKFDSILQLSPGGQVLGGWSTFQNLEVLQELHEPSVIDSPAFANTPSDKLFDYYHLNTIEVLPDTPLGRTDPRFRAGNYLLCLRNADLIVILDQASMKIVWHWGPGDLDYPHMPTMLANGNLLIFDNGRSRDHSRIVELKPRSLEIVWEYRADPPQDFWSQWRGSNQRLPNGNTLICESERGRVFEVTAAGEIVWEFWNPEIDGGKRKRIYRFTRVPREEFFHPR